MSVTSYSITRPNQGRYFSTSDMHYRASTPCARKGVALAIRIGHCISGQPRKITGYVK